MSLHDNYQVDPALVGRRVDLGFDPFDLTDISARFGDRHLGAAVPHLIGRHVHPAARPEHPDRQPADNEGGTPPSTGIDYLNLVRDRHADAILDRRVNYADLGTDQPQHEREPDPALDAAPDPALASFAALVPTDRPATRPGQRTPSSST